MFPNKKALDDSAIRHRLLAVNIPFAEAEPYIVVRIRCSVVRIERESTITRAIFVAATHCENIALILLLLLFLYSIFAIHQQCGQLHLYLQSNRLVYRPKYIRHVVRA